MLSHPLLVNDLVFLHGHVFIKHNLAEFNPDRGLNEANAVLPSIVNLPTRLQCLDVPIVEPVACQASYPGMISPRMMCVGFMDGGRDVCNVRFTIY